MRDKKEHKELIEEYYPNGCTLDENHSNPTFASPEESREVAEQRKKEFFDKTK